MKEIIGDYTGTLLSDGYAAYERYAAQHAGVTHAQQWGGATGYFVGRRSARSKSALFKAYW
ncbi:MAG: hypothetical protein GXP19_01195 [Gammaproteobacteria bacterium]|nr:hypothetical protein [Gammaproteobacteria bacterium]